MGAIRLAAALIGLNWRKQRLLLSFNKSELDCFGLTGPSHACGALATRTHTQAVSKLFESNSLSRLTSSHCANYCPNSALLARGAGLERSCYSVKARVLEFSFSQPGNELLTSSPHTRWMSSGTCD